ncbi:hypothetical protein GCM10023189_30620 [Nibrella saemangeumensis]|uniref:TonB C-terminal domain-containing protein n=1 Tax=Nibrella saemangeumensis TaxID=1084526 RepID=A0ABP8N1M4_9BACT
MSNTYMPNYHALRWITFMLQVVALLFTASQTLAQEREIFTVVEKTPRFPGGMQNLVPYLSQTIRYPAEARQNGVEGKVFVSFVVNMDGSISDVTVLKGLGYGTDEEAVRVVSNMPKWEPGTQRGRPVNVKYNLPIAFSLGHDRPSGQLSTPPSLVIVDGKEMTQGFDLKTLNPNRIEKMEIFRGESAKAVYGEKARDGVVVITTKK